MPLGNLTSQFFANVYLDELDKFVKHKLKAKHYIRYVDDFVILHVSKQWLELCKSEINNFLMCKLNLQLHSDKTKIFQISKGTSFLGLRIFPHHKLLKKRNIRKFESKLNLLSRQFNEKQIDYDKIYDFLEGWVAYAKNANTYNYRKSFMENIEKKFKSEISTKEINRYFRLAKLSFSPR